jgi:hypothetical protein
MGYGCGDGRRPGIRGGGPGCGGAEAAPPPGPDQGGAPGGTGQEKKGESTAGVKRQHMGCADGAGNGINTVHLSYVREKTGHALAGFRQWIPGEQVKDVRASLRMALPPALTFPAKGQLAAGILKDACADGVFSGFTCGDEACGACAGLRGFPGAGGAGARAAGPEELLPYFP